MKNRTAVKICGIKSPEILAVAAQLNIDAVGFVLYPPSPRYVEPTELAELQRLVPAFTTRVGLLVDPSLDQVKALIDKHWVDTLQFHGHETGQFCEQFGFPYIKALSAQAAMQAENYWQRVAEEYPSAQAFLIDTPDPVLQGGTGRTFDWRWWPEQAKKALILAGGLNADNVGVAIGKMHPYAVDVSGGVESSRGHKCPKAMRAFVEAVARADSFCE